MVSHTTLVAATSPVVTTARAPVAIPALGGAITKTLSPQPPLAAVCSSVENKKLSQLLELGNIGFDSDDDEDAYADVYVRALQAALRAAARRNQRASAAISTLRAANAKLRQEKCTLSLRK